MEIEDEYEMEFKALMQGKYYNIIKNFFDIEIDNYLLSLDKATRLRINSWCKKFEQVPNNLEWRKNRNLHAINLLDMLIKKKN